VAAAQSSGREIGLVFDLAERRVTASGEIVSLSTQNFALLLWMAQRRKAGLGPIQCSKTGNMEAANEFLTICRQLDAEDERTRNSLKSGMDSTWFSPAKTRLHDALTRALGKSGAAPYLIQASGPKKGDRFELTLAAEHIHLKGGR